MTRVIAVANSKGGVGKSTTAVNLGASLSKRGRKVLLVDCDSQANMSKYVGYVPDGNITLSELFAEVSTNGKIDPERVLSAIRHSEENRLDYIPSSINLANAEVYLLNAISRETVLRRILKKEVKERYDYIILDCLPSLGILLINALSVATDLLIPVQTQEFSLDGLDSLLGVFGQVRDTINPDIRIAGFLPTWVENTVVSRSALVDLKYNYGEHLLNTRIKKSAEAGKSVKRRKAMCFYKNDLGPQYDYLAAELEG